MRRISDDWKRLIAISRQLVAQSDRTGSVVIEHLAVGLPYNEVLSRHQSWQNKYARCTQRGLIDYPYKIRRIFVDDHYVIEAALDVSAVIEETMVAWPDDPT